MGDPQGFLTYERKTPTRRPVPVRLRDWKEVYEDFSADELKHQAARCMDCGIPFCNNGCPLGNLIPDWNDLVYRDQWKEAIDRLHATNNFPEFTGRLCPAPCEGACVVGISGDPVTIKQVEVTIIERAFEEGWVEPILPSKVTGKAVAIVGSGPAGLAVAQQLTRAGHRVVVFERADRIGGLLRYGIPEFKMEKWVLDRRLDQMRAEGTEFRVNANIGGPADDPTAIPIAEIDAEFDAIVLSGGSTTARDLPVPGRELEGIYQAMEYLPPSNKVQHGDMDESSILATDKHVIIIGGGDTGADCLGTAHRQGAASVSQFEIMPRPPEKRGERTPWPTFPVVYKVTSAHEEGGDRLFSVNTTKFTGVDGKVKKLHGNEVGPDFKAIPGTEFEMDADLVLLAMGFVGPEKNGLLSDLQLELDQRGNVVRDANWTTSAPKVFACGDMGRGQSLIVWAIAEGRSCAAAVDASLMGETLLPSPVKPTDRPLV